MCVTSTLGRLLFPLAYDSILNEDNKYSMFPHLLCINYLWFHNELPPSLVAKNHKYFIAYYSGGQVFGQANKTVHGSSM